ncbi:MAG: D-alanyl-D-alanine carboxypeptidase [Alphaproteobacteria bacterium]|nr:D-alanyl-D-alanine carboxypeptidase [Alphaproteobacteria bacterium]
MKLKPVVSFAGKLLAVWLALGMFGLSVAEARPQFSAITVDARTGQILFQDSIDGLRHPASLTKMMTLYVLFQDLKAGRITRATRLHVSARAAAMAPSKLNMHPGSTLTVDEAIKALVTKSANDVAATIAENLGGSEANFAARMTRVAHSIGMNHSTFKNASGLPNPEQYTTARDMATLGLHLMRDFPQYYPYFRVTAFNFHGRTIRTHNRLVEHYPGTDGIKTGYIADAGFNLVTSTRRGDKRLVGVVLGARSSATRGRFMMAMFEKNFPKAKEGQTIASIAGSSQGVINPLAEKNTAQAAAEPAAAADAVDSKELAAAAQDAASGEVDANASDEDQGDQVATNATTPASTPKVLQAALDTTASNKLPNKLPFAVVSANDAPANLATELATSWNIQIGSYPDKNQADAKIASIRGQATKLLQGKPGFTIAADVKGKTVYRARFAGFDAATAKRVCAKLSRAGNGCLPIAPQS